MTCCYEPLKESDRERRDGLGKTTLGDTGKPRKQPHRGCDWGYKNGSRGRDFVAIHSGKVASVIETGELGWTTIVKRSGCKNPACEGVYDEYNHSLEKSALKVGAEVLGGRTVLNQMGDKGSPGANHLHASSAKNPVPHNAPREQLRDLFKEIDACSKQRKANMDAKKLAASKAALPEPE